MVPLQALVRLTRLWNLLIVALTQFCTAGFLVGTETLSDPRLMLLALSTVLVAAGGYSINDYYDVKIDLINKPERVVVGKTLPRRFVLLLHTLLTVSGIGLGFLLSWLIGGITFICGFLLWLYSNALKRLPFIGNFIVAVLTGLSVWMVNLLFPPNRPAILVYALFAFFLTLIREIIKDMEDLKGDNTFGCRTLPIVWGLRGTKLFIYLIVMLFCTTVVGIHMVVTPLPVTFFVGFLLIPLGILVAWLIRADTRRDYYRLSQLSKLIMLGGIFSMALL
jgi:4-hydroxybenzoate polyprenyltransferase